MDDFEGGRLEERKLMFEANRHMSTLSVAALVLMFTLDQRFSEDPETAERGLLLFGVSLFFSVLGMFSTVGNEWLARQLSAVPGKLCFALSAVSFGVGVLILLLIPAVF